MGIIEFDRISLKFGTSEILKDFSLSIKKGEKILISGKSGKGKSTLLKLLLGFETFEKGEIYINNFSISLSESFDIRKNFAYVNQDVTLRHGNVKEVLKEISQFSGNNYNGKLDDGLCDLFEFDLNLLEKNTEQLSGGERQRLGIIIAIMLNRPIFLLDEVTSGLDENLKIKVVDYFSNSTATVISVSHDKVWSENTKFRKVEL